MKKYYIIRADGSSIFQEAYPEDFIFHCLVKLLDRTPDEAYRLCEIDRCQIKRLSLSAKKATAPPQVATATGGFAGVAKR